MRSMFLNLLKLSKIAKENYQSPVYFDNFFVWYEDENALKIFLNPDSTYTISDYKDLEKLINESGINGNELNINIKEYLKNEINTRIILK